MSIVLKTFYQPSTWRVIQLPRLYQGEREVCILINGLPKDGRTFYLESTLENDRFVYARCKQIGEGLYSIRDDLLIDGRNIYLYLFSDDTGVTGRSLQKWELPIIRRPKRGYEV